MADFNIPQYPTNKADFPQVKALDRKIVAAAVLLGLPNQEAYKLYHPEFLDSNGKLNKSGAQASTQFWGYGKVKDYREAFEKEIAEFLGKSGKRVAVSEGDTISDKRKDEALKSLFDKAMTLVEGQGDLDADTLKIAAEIFKKIGLLKDEVEQQEAPRRYLPCRCSECDYRSFVESYVETGEIENSCLRCKALDIAKENGFRYDPKTLLRPNDEKTAD